MSLSPPPLEKEQKMYVLDEDHGMVEKVEPVQVNGRPMYSAEQVQTLMEARCDQGGHEDEPWEDPGLHITVSRCKWCHRIA